MADVKISIKDEQSARNWLALVEDINTDYHKAMTDAAETMINMQDFAEGTLVDEFAKYGTQLLNAAETTFNAINEISSLVNKILSNVSKFVGDVVSGVTKLANKILT